MKRDSKISGLRTWSAGLLKRTSRRFGQGTQYPFVKSDKERGRVPDTQQLIRDIITKRVEFYPGGFTQEEPETRAFATAGNRVLTEDQVWLTWVRRSGRLAPRKSAKGRQLIRRSGLGEFL